MAIGENSLTYTHPHTCIHTDGAGTGIPLFVLYVRVQFKNSPFEKRDARVEERWRR